jgi:hypothetical protein
MSLHCVTGLGIKNRQADFKLQRPQNITSPQKEILKVLTTFTFFFAYL